MTEGARSKQVTKKVAARAIERALKSEPKSLRVTEGQRRTFSRSTTSKTTDR